MELRAQEGKTVRKQAIHACQTMRSTIKERGREGGKMKGEKSDNQGDWVRR